MNDVAQSTAEDVAGRIREKVDNSPFGNAKCTVSIGVCCMEPESSTSLSEAISIADKFMYVAKQSGGNSVKICT
jgi:diguanylate cyclase (GGDEF)-like protein